ARAEGSRGETFKVTSTGFLPAFAEALSHTTGSELGSELSSDPEPFARRVLSSLSYNFLGLLNPAVKSFTLFLKRQRAAALQKLAHISKPAQFAKPLGVRQPSAAFNADRR